MHSLSQHAWSNLNRELSLTHCDERMIVVLATTIE